MILFKILLCFLFSLNIFAAENYIDSITITKVKKLIKKEEEIAFAYKKYVLEKGKNPSDITTLIDNKYLPKGFSTINSFGKEIKFSTDTSKSNSLENSIPTSIDLKTNLFDYYYSDKFRVNTKAPISKNNNTVQIILSSKEKFIYDKKNSITTIKADAKNKYYLDGNGVLHWYDNTGVYKFSFNNKELLVAQGVSMIDGNGKTLLFTSLMNGKDVLYSGETILQNGDSTALEYLNLGSSAGIIKVNSKTRDIGKTVIQFSRRAGGMIVNGDIYTWGNNANKITGIDINNYTREDGKSGSSSKFPVITGLVRVKAKIYDDDSKDNKDLTKFYDNNYFSSPLRPKFVDFFSTIYHSTCGVSTTGGLYCGGSKGDTYSFGNNFTQTDKANNETHEMLYRSTFFNGISNKASKIFANNQIWLILSQEGDIYRWGYDWSGFSGNGSTSFNYPYPYNLSPQKLTITDLSTNVKFTDITYLLTIGYRKMGALSTTGDIYMWGIESEIASGKCSEKWENINFNLCEPTKVSKNNSTLSSNITFQSIYGGLEAFVGLSTDGKYYKIHQPKDKKIQVELINDSIKSYSTYVKENDSSLLSVDFSSKLSGSSLKLNEGIVWVNSRNELKGDYFTSDNVNDLIFKSAIAKIKWKKIKVIADDNGMCGIDIYNQMYCWGIQSFYRTSYPAGNTFMIPVFNTNLYDLDKDYLLAEAGDNYVTNMTSGEWTTSDSSKPFFIKYPTYIGGFNYEFIFK